jgi:hypothetical protein
LGQAPNESQLAEWRDERDALCRTLLANPNDPARAKVQHRLRVLSFLMKRYNVADSGQDFADLGSAPSIGELDPSAIKPFDPQESSESSADPFRSERELGRAQELIGQMALDVPEDEAIDAFRMRYGDSPEQWMIDAARSGLHDREVARGVYFRRCLEKGMSLQLATLWYEWEVGLPPEQWMIVEAIRYIENRPREPVTITEDEILQILGQPDSRPRAS